MIEDLKKKKYCSIIASFLERLPKCIIVRFAKRIETFSPKGQERCRSTKQGLFKKNMKENMDVPTPKNRIRTLQETV